MADFGDDVKAYHTWIVDARTSIIKEEREGLYKQYVRSMFRTYLTVDNEEFVDAIKVEKRLWTQGNQLKGYSFRDLMQMETATCNNLVASNEWKENGKQTSNKEDVKFLTLSVQFKDLKKSLDSNSNSKSNSNSNSGNHNED